MAHGQARARTVLVRLRSMTPRVRCGPAIRRLLVIGGIAAAGWLLGSAGQAHAETGRAHAETGRAHAETGRAHAAGVTAAVISALPEGSQEPVPGRIAKATGASAAPIRAALGAALDDGSRSVRGAVAPVRTSKIERLVTRIVPAVDGTGPDAPRPPRHPHPRVHADAGDDTRTTVVNGAALRSASGAAEGVRGGPVQVRTGTADPAPQPGFPGRTRCEAGALPSAGSAPTGGVVGHPARFGVVARPATVHLAPVVGAIPPAVHAATDEPALSPD